MILCGLMKNSAVDYPGLLAATVFTGGCNFNCFYCHNRQLIGASGPKLSEGQVLDFLQKRVGMLDGVVISGGEPTLQRDLRSFVTKVHQMGYSIKLDTNGSRPDVVEDLLIYQLIHYVAMDYKAPFDKSDSFCGVPADISALKQTMALLALYTKNAQQAWNWQLRTTVAPTLTVKDILTMAEQLEHAPPSWVFNRYRIPEGHDDPRLQIPPLTKQQVEGLFESINQRLPNTKLIYNG